ERYLHAAVRNKALNRLRHAVVEQRAAAGMLSAPIDEPTVESGLDGAAGEEERAARLARAIAQLPPRRREVLMLRWQRGLSYQEIAAVTGTTVKAVELQLYRTLRALRRLVAAPTE